MQVHILIIIKKKKKVAFLNIFKINKTYHEVLGKLTLGK